MEPIEGCVRIVRSYHRERMGYDFGARGALQSVSEQGVVQIRRKCEYSISVQPQ